MRLIPCSNAARIVSSASCSSVPPQLKPPIDQVPNLIRDTSRFKPLTFAYSMVLVSPNEFFNGRDFVILSRRLRRPPKLPRVYLSLPKFHDQQRSSGHRIYQTSLPPEGRHSYRKAPNSRRAFRWSHRHRRTRLSCPKPLLRPPMGKR